MAEKDRVESSVKRLQEAQRHARELHERIEALKEKRLREEAEKARKAIS